MTRTSILTIELYILAGCSSRRRSI